MVPPVGTSAYNDLLVAYSAACNNSVKKGGNGNVSPPGAVRGEWYKKSRQS